MSELGRRPAPAAAHEAPEPVEAPRALPSPDGAADRSQPLRDPMAFVRHERQAAATQIGRSLKAWRRPAGGDAPPPAMRAAVEAETGADLSTARVHHGADAAAAADRAGARAFTVGRDVHFGAGQLQPGTRAGDRLLAHELAHAAQPTGGVERAPDPAKTPADATAVSQPHEPSEQRADAVAERATERVHGGGDGGKPSTFQSRAEKSDQALDTLGGKLSPEQAGAVGQLRAQTKKLATDAVTGLSSRGMLSTTLADSSSTSAPPTSRRSSSRPTSRTWAGSTAPSAPPPPTATSAP